MFCRWLIAPVPICAVMKYGLFLFETDALDVGNSKTRCSPRLSYTDALDLRNVAI